MKIRKLCGRDVRLVGPVIGRALKNMGGEAQAFAQDKQDTQDKQGKKDRAAIGRRLIAYLLENEIEAIWPWLADLAGMTEAELDDQPIGTAVQILQALKEDPGLQSFLSSVPGAGSGA